MNTNEDQSKADSLLKNAAEKAAALLKEAAEKAALLPIDAAEKAALLPIDAAEKAAQKLKDAAENIPQINAETQAALLLKDAAQQVALMPKDSVSKMTELLNDATKRAVLILKEEADSLAAKKIMFLDIAAHELRNPITSVSLLLKVAEKQIEIGQTPSNEIIVRLRAPVDRLVRLVVDLLDMSKLESRLLSLTFTKTNLVSLVTKCLEEFQVQAIKHKILFNKTSDVIEVNIDPIRINQVLENFLDNALKYTTEGPIEVGINEMPTSIRVSVTDHGPGIPIEKQDTLFTTFSRGSSELTIHTSGLGLGLAVCKGIIDLHNGTIGVESEVGKGSTFYFELPKSKTTT